MIILEIMKAIAEMFFWLTCTCAVLFILNLIRRRGLDAASRMNKLEEKQNRIEEEMEENQNLIYEQLERSQSYMEKQLKETRNYFEEKLEQAKSCMKERDTEHGREYTGNRFMEQRQEKLAVHQSANGAASQFSAQGESWGISQRPAQLNDNCSFQRQISSSTTQGLKNNDILTSGAQNARCQGNRTIGPKFAKGRVGEEFLFTESADGKMTIVSEGENEITVMPNIDILKETDYRHRGISRCFETNGEVEPGKTFKIINKKMGCIMEKYNGDYRVKEKGKIDIALHDGNPDI